MPNIQRQPTLSEIAYFSANPNVAGMMTEDQRVTLPPDTRFGRESVLLNEKLRLLLQNYAPKSKLSDLQRDMFSGSAYANDPTNAMRSILARIGSRDQSANATFEQDSEYRRLSGLGGLLGGYGR